MERFNGDVWLRSHRGAGGKGALRVSDINTAISWLDMNDGWGSFTASERITGADSVVETVWNRGELVFAQGRTRKRGTPGNLREPRRYRRASTVGAPPEVNDVGLKAIRSVMAKPHGIFFADQKIDSNGLPRVTEVNTGRFSSNGSIYWFDKGPNLAEIVIKLGMGQKLDINVPLINPLPEDLYRLSGDDIPFKYVRQDATRPLEAELEQRLSRL